MQHFMLFIYIILFHTDMVSNMSPLSFLILVTWHASLSVLSFCLSLSSVLLKVCHHYWSFQKIGFGFTNFLFSLSLFHFIHFCSNHYYFLPSACFIFSLLFFPSILTCRVRILIWGLLLKMKKNSAAPAACGSSQTRDQTSTTAATQAAAVTTPDP